MAREPVGHPESVDAGWSHHRMHVFTVDGVEAGDPAAANREIVRKCRG
jgi:hypothetical protein